MAVDVLESGYQLSCHPTEVTHKEKLRWRCRVGSIPQNKLSNCSVASQPQISWSCVAASSALLRIKHSKKGGKTFNTQLRGAVPSNRNPIHFVMENCL